MKTQEFDLERGCFFNGYWKSLKPKYEHVFSIFSQILQPKNNFTFQK